MYIKVKKFLHEEWKEPESRFDLIALSLLVLSCVALSSINLLVP